VRFVNLKLKVVMQSDRDFVNVILLYWHSLFCWNVSCVKVKLEIAWQQMC
jgi:hypothetical protein